MLAVYASGHKKTLTPWLIDQDISVTGTTSKRLTLNRPITQIDLPVPIALSVMLFARDLARRMVLRMSNLDSFFLGHRPVDLRLVFHVIDMTLLLVQAGGFLLIQLPAGNAFIDSLFLIGLPLIDARRLSLGIGHS
jgi:hypothetical protein